MTTTTSAPSPASAHHRTATYFVVPVLPDTGKTENVRYYAADQGAKQWLAISPKDLDAKGQGCDANQIRLHQPSAESVLAHTDLTAGQLDGSATLYAGVARTLSTGTDPLPSGYTVDSDGYMTIQVAQLSTRGLILVFSRTAGGDPSASVTDLIATTDPEIKNGVGT